MTLLQDFATQIFKKSTLIKLLFALLCVQIVIVGVFSFVHDPHFSFDESNTLRISSQEPREILNILALEQNFPLYYLVLHFFLNLGISAHEVVLVHFLFWVASVFCFYKITKSLKMAPLFSTWSTLLYTLCSGFWYYAFYVRPYMPIILVDELILLLLIQLKPKDKTKIALLSFLIILACMLHPGQIVLGGILSLSLFSLKKFRKAAFLILFLSSFTFLGNVSLKANFGNQVSVGTEYLTGLNAGLGGYVNGLLSSNDYGLMPLMWVLLLCFLYLIYKNKNVSIKKRSLFYTVIAVSTFLALAIDAGAFITNHAIAGRHFLNLAPAVLIGLLVLLGKSSNREKIALGGILTLVLLLQNQVFLNTMIQRENAAQLFCTEIKTHKEATYITDFHVYNPISYCKLSSPKQVLLLHRTGVTDITNSSELEILKIQSMQGGALTPAAKLQFAQYLSKNPSQLEFLKSQLKNTLRSETGYYAVNIEANDWFSSKELELLSDLVFVKFTPPSIYSFQKRLQ